MAPVFGWISEDVCRHRDVARNCLVPCGFKGRRGRAAALSGIQPYMGPTGQMIRISATVIAIPAAGGSMCVSPC